MKSITIYPKNEKQITLLKSLLEEMKVRFKIDKNVDDTLLSEKEFYAKIDKSIKHAESGKVQNISEEKQKEILGL